MSLLHTHIGSQPGPAAEAAGCHHGMAWAACSVLDGLAMPVVQGANAIRSWSGVDRADMWRKQDRSSGQPA